MDLNILKESFVKIKPDDTEDRNIDFQELSLDEMVEFYFDHHKKQLLNKKPEECKVIYFERWLEEFQKVVDINQQS